MNDIGVVSIRTTAPVIFDHYRRCRQTGSFILIDRVTQGTSAAGMIVDGVPDQRREDCAAHNPNRQRVSREMRETLNGHGAVVIWFTGLSGSGKTSIAAALEALMHAKGFRTYLLDGDDIRGGLNRDLGFGRADRGENIRRVGEVARLMIDAGLVVLCAFISPYRADRDGVRSLVDTGRFIEVHVSTPVEVCEARDAKGLYRRARSGEIREFTGVSSPYEEPLRAEITVDASRTTIEEAAAVVFDCYLSLARRALEG
jgi:bifunctional enzyme CysN/CysC